MEGEGVSPFFGSDNQAGIHPKVLAALAAASPGFASSYGDDPLTREAEARWSEALGGQCRVFFSFNGTAANILSLVTALQSFEAVLCGRRAHITEDECGAPEAIVGTKLLEVPLDGNGKVTVEALAPFVAERGVVHHVQPRLLSITQPTEFGTVYTLAELEGLSSFAKKHGLFFHIDGARLANAATRLGVPLRRLAADAGVDILSMGATKGGIAIGDAFAVFRPEWLVAAEFHRKQKMQLASKMRFLSAQFLAYLDGDLWKEVATHSLGLAEKLGGELTKRGFPPKYPVESNGVFVQLPEEAGTKLSEQFHFYRWEAERPVFRLMTSFATTDAHVAEFLAAFDKILSASR